MGSTERGALLAARLRRCAAAAALVALGLETAGCEAGAEGERTLWRTGPPPLRVAPDWRPDGEPRFALLDSMTRFATGGMTADGGAGAMWCAYVAGPDSTPQIHWVRIAADGKAHEEAASVAGREPRLATLPAGGVAMVSLGAGTPPRLVARRADAPGGAWSAPVDVSSRAGTPVIGSGRLVALRDGSLVVPVSWSVADGAAEVVLHASHDGGASWEEVASLPEASDASLADAADGGLVLVTRRGAALARQSSGDGGHHWSAPESLRVSSRRAPFALQRAAQSGELALAWTDADPDTTVALPALQSLRVAFSSDGGATWGAPRVVALRPGRVPSEPALVFDARRFVAAFTERAAPGSPAGERVVCVGLDRASLERDRSVAAPQARYGLDPAAAREALRILCAHTLNRPAGARRFFVEGYFMRSLVEAYAVFDSLPQETPEWFDARAGLATAIAWADHVVETQDATGYFATGYGAQFLADMAAGVLFFPALEPYAGAERMQRYETAARRFVAAMQADAMLLPSGAVGIGWPGSFIPRAPRRERRDPYLVSTALAGIELHAWLYHRGGKVEDRDRARGALDFTLAALQPDGSLPGGPMVASDTEGSFVAASYVEEGWIAADVLLRDPEVLARLRAALPQHVAWLLAKQRPDGGWDGGADGEFARTPAILNFLMWYDQRCESRPDVRAAIRRAGERLVDPARWDEVGLFRAGNHHEVQRAIAGRPLVALARQRFVP